MNKLSDYRSDIECGDTGGWLIFKDSSNNWRIKYLFGKHVGFGAKIIYEKQLKKIEDEMILEYNKRVVEEEKRKEFNNKLLLMAALIVNVVLICFNIYLMI